MASSTNHRPHSVTDRWRSSADEAASAVQNVTSASFFFLFVAIRKNKNKDYKDRILEKQEEEEKDSPCVPPLHLIVVCCIKSLILHSPPLVKLLRLLVKRFLCRVIVLLRKNIVFLVFPLNLNVLNKKSDIESER